jgi:hypothetical protein
MMQISDRILIMMPDLENLPNKEIEKEFKEGFRILKQYQIKEIFWSEAN